MSPRATAALFDVVFAEERGEVKVRCRCDVAGGRTEWVAVPGEDLSEIARRFEVQGREPTDREAQRKLGFDLFTLLFQGSNRRLFDRARGDAQCRGVPFLLRLCLADRPSLSAVPWELLYDGFEFLAKAPLCSLVRSLENASPIRTSPVEPPLRILLTGGPPRGGETIDLSREARALEVARQKTNGRVAKPVVKLGVSWEDLEELLSPGIHVWLHCGHGSFLASDPERYSLLLRNQGGGTESVPADRIDELAARCPDLWMVILGCCHGGAFNGLATQLARLNVPLVLGFPWQVGLPIAGQLGVTLLRGLVDRAPELACGTARSALAAKVPDSLEWSQPLLFSRRTSLEPLLLPVKPPAAKTARPRTTPAVRRPSIPGKRRVSLDIEGVRAGRDARIEGADDATIDDVRLRVRDVEAAGDVAVRGVARERQYRKELAELLAELEAGDPEGSDA